MTTGDAINLAIAGAAWLAVLLQHRAFKLSTKEAALRVDRLQEIVAQLEKEREERRSAIADKSVSDLHLQRENARLEVKVTLVMNSLVGLQTLILHAQFGALFLAHRDRVVQEVPDASHTYDRLHVAALEYLGRWNYMTAQANGRRSPRPEDLAVDDNLQLMMKALEEVASSGQELMRNLEACRVISSSDGGSLSRYFEFMRHSAWSARDALERFHSQEILPARGLG